MNRNKTPLYVIVNSANVALATANDMAEARAKRDQLGALGIKLFSDHKGDKSQIGY
jgi:hypothetical protein